MTAEKTSLQLGSFKDLSNLWWRHMHGLGGVTFLISCIAEFIQFIVRKQATLSLTVCIVLTGLPFALGILSKTFLRRLLRLKHKKFVFMRGIAWTLAFISLMISIYAQPNFFESNPIWVRWVGTAVYAIASLSAVSIGLYEFFADVVYTSGFLIANVSTTFLLFSMPFIHLTLGTYGLTQLYLHYNIAGIVYVFAIVSAFCTAIDNFVLGLTTSRRLSFSFYIRMGGILWVGFYYTITTALMWYIITWQAALTYYMFVGVLYYLTTLFRIPVEKNRAGFIDSEDLMSISQQ